MCLGFTPIGCFFCKVHVSAHMLAVSLCPERHIPLSGAIIVFPSRVNEYSTAIAFDFVTRLSINPVDSRLRRVLVSIRCETLPR